jgi:hypothetical protein
MVQASPSEPETPPARGKDMAAPAASEPRHPVRPNSQPMTHSAVSTGICPNTRGGIGQHIPTLDARSNRPHPLKSKDNKASPEAPAPIGICCDASLRPWYYADQPIPWPNSS